MPQFVAAITITQHEEEALGARVTEFSHKRRGYGPGSLSTRRFVVQGPDGRSSAKTKKEPLPPSSAPPSAGISGASFCRLFLGHDQSKAGGKLSVFHPPDSMGQRTRVDSPQEKDMKRGAACDNSPD